MHQTPSVENNVLTSKNHNSIHVVCIKLDDHAVALLQQREMHSLLDMKL